MNSDRLKKYDVMIDIMITLNPFRWSLFNYEFKKYSDTIQLTISSLFLTLYASVYRTYEIEDCNQPNNYSDIQSSQQSVNNQPLSYENQ